MEAGVEVLLVHYYKNIMITSAVAVVQPLVCISVLFCRKHQAMFCVVQLTTSTYVLCCSADNIKLRTHAKHVLFTKP